MNALNHLLITYHPSQIVLGGDSAGGHLILSLLAHLKRSCPLAEPIIGIGGSRSIRGVYIISPWVAMNYNSKSFRGNTGRDYIRAKAMVSCTDIWNPLDDIWAQPLTGTSNLWESLPVDNILITAGSWESFLDDIKEMGNLVNAKKFGTGSSVEICIGEKEVHVQCALDKALGNGYGGSAQNILC